MKIVLVLLLVAACTKTVNLKNLVPHIQFKLPKNDKNIVLENQYNQGINTGIRIGFENSKDSISVDSINEVDSFKAQSLFKNKALMIKGLYEKQATPYSGVVTREASCLEGMVIENNNVIETPNEMSLKFDLKATERHVFGVCLEEQNIFRTQILLLYCKKNQTFYEIKYFYPKSEPVLKNNVAACD
jgi:hypothetical protein